MDTYTVVILLMLIDYISGLLKAIYTGKLNSYVSFKGLIKKFGILIILVLSYIIDTYAPVDVELLPLTLLFYITNEVISILENLIVMNIPVPSFIKDRFNRDDD